MKAADAREPHHTGSRAGEWLDRASRRRILGESEMCLVDLVLGDEIGEQQPQLPIGQDDELIERLPANGGDEALGDPALPRAAEAGPGGRDAHEPKC